MQGRTVGRPMEILVVEDDLLQARLTMEAIRRSDFLQRTSLVPDGQQALDFIFHRGVFSRAPHSDLVLLDLRLPTIDGLEVLSEIRAVEECKSVPVVIMTSSQDESDRLACEHHDVEAYLTKPIDLPKFLALLTELRRFWHRDMILPQGVRLS
jgi:CheY-like chemotaxis protein